MKSGYFYFGKNRTFSFCIALKLMILTAVILCLTVSVSFSARAKDSPSGSVITDINYKEGRLKVSAEAQDFQGVINRVAEETGVKLSLTIPVDEKITAHFDLPLEEGLQRILDGKSYIFLYSAKARLSHVMVLTASAEDSQLFYKAINDNSVSGRTLQDEEDQKISASDRERLKEMLEDYTGESEDITDQIYNSLEDMKNTLKDIKNIENEVTNQLAPLQ
jgi:hypothetical protein